MSAHSPVNAAIAIGSNVGDRYAHVAYAVAAIAGLARTRILRRSRVIQTQPVGPPGGGGGDPGGPYLNAAITIRTSLSPHDLIHRLHDLERDRGRDRTAEHERWLPRTLDLDLLLYGQQTINQPALTVPHPRMAERSFVLVPLAEIAPDWPVPGADATVADLLARLSPNPAGTS